MRDIKKIMQLEAKKDKRGKLLAQIVGLIRDKQSQIFYHQNKIAEIEHNINRFEDAEFSVRHNILSIEEAVMELEVDNEE